MDLLLFPTMNINVQTSHGETALHLAAGEGHADVVKVLLDRGADTSIKDLYGKTAAEYANTSLIKGLLSSAVSSSSLKSEAQMSLRQGGAASDPIGSKVLGIKS